MFTFQLLGRSEGGVVHVSDRSLVVPSTWSAIEELEEERQLYSGERRGSSSSLFLEEKDRRIAGGLDWHSFFVVSDAMGLLYGEEFVALAPLLFVFLLSLC